MKKFMTTPLGSFVKGFFSIVIAMYFKDVLAAKSIFIPITKDLINELVIAGLVPNIQILLNWINPEYKNYGIGKDNGDDNSDPSGASGIMTILIFFIALTALVSACNP